MKNLRDLKVLTIHDVKSMSDEYVRGGGAGFRGLCRGQWVVGFRDSSLDQRPPRWRVYGVGFEN